MDEEWRVIEDAPNYEVSEYGDVRNRSTGRILRTSRSHNGYVICGLRVNGISIGRRVHRLVAQAFLDPDPYRDQVNHKNTNKLDNHYSNLEWATSEENIHHAMANGVFSTDHQSKAVRVVQTGEVFRSQSACARALGVPQASISLALRGGTINTQGYTFEWA